MTESSGSRLNGRTDAAKFYRHNTPLLSAAAALNSGIVAFAFFTLREHAISPVLSNARSKTSDKSGRGDENERPLTWSMMRTYHLEDSALTGALLGGGLNAWMKGPKGIIPGMVTASLACSTLQLIVNELDVRRIRYVSSRTSRSSSITTLNADGVNVSDSTTAESGNTPTDSDSQPGMGERLLRLIGITKVDDTEYLRRLKAKREKYLERIRELEEAEQTQKLEGEREVGSEFARDTGSDRGMRDRRS
ncbi:uncharacterized protein FOMMEDRAFT_147370 [Fomitiporia mediterranea MF3/22]|uniref:uncharacterized protein n=1 Tax=Fomitiporia mediterranea (strain MF3/22) TaxID=694068 RepID=UPI0004407451|nr:uncharacterized protein FOMMEDRAFT_147370 [Fomitiporia mediterranea MF3/22]EJD02385.1 hypothetical protein FOMMEDRAFT_147370 [Fomitiporia mediterranea MF3/22]